MLSVYANNAERQKKTQGNATKGLSNQQQRQK